MFKRISKWNISVVAWVVLTIVFVYFFRGNFIIWEKDDYNQSGLTYTQVNMASDVILQEIDFSDSVQTLSFLMVNTGSDGQCVLDVFSTTTNELIWSTTLVVPASNGSEVAISVNVPMDVIKAGTYLLKMSSATNDTIFVCVEDASFGKVYSENDVTMEKHLRMNVVYGASYDIVILALFTIGLLIAGLAMIYAVKNSLTIEKLFVVYSLLFGVLMAFINPFGQEPDGMTHFMRAVDVSNGNLLLPFWDNNGASAVFRLPDNINDIQFIKIEPDESTALTFGQNVKHFYFSENVVDVNVYGGFSSFFYLPQAFGICIARLFGVSAYWWMFFARISNLLCYTFLAYVGIKKTPIYKNIFMVIALLPMTVYQAASVSYDAMINGFSILFVGLCFSMAYGEKEKLDWKDTILLGVILAGLFMGKYIYICLGLLVFLIPKDKFGDIKNYIKTFGISLIPLIFVVVSVLFSSMMPSATSLELTTVTEESVEVVKQMTQVEYVLQNPIQYIKTMILTIVNHFEFYIKMLNTLGWMNYSLNILQFFVPLFMVVVAILDSKGIENRVKNWNRSIMFVTFVLVLVLGMTGLYLFDSYANPVGAQVVSGYQTRYAIPGMIVLLSSFTSVYVKNTIKYFSYRVCGVMGMFLAYSALTVWMICY